MSQTKFRLTFVMSTPAAKVAAMCAAKLKNGTGIDSEVSGSAHNFKADRSDSSSSKLDSSAELDDKARESDDDILGLIGDSKKLKATLDDEQPQMTASDNRLHAGITKCPTTTKALSHASSTASSIRTIPSALLVSDNDTLTDQDSFMDSDLELIALKDKKKSTLHYCPSKKQYDSSKSRTSKGGLKCLQQREQEEPTWNTPKEVADMMSSDGPPVDDQVWGGIHRCEKTAYEGSKLTTLTMVIAIHLQPEGHIGGIRTNIRKAAQVHVASHYGLMKGANERVADLLKNNAYIYPANTKVHLPSILNTIEDAFFNDKLTAGVKWHGHLTSTFEDHPNEAELPITMVVFAITAVCSIIMQYSTEKYDQDFNSGMYGRIYQTLVSILNGIFKTVYGSKRKTEEPDAADSLMFLNIEGMVEE
ncbi:hypothetical protein EV424DRAFT_1536324 [Suillus variegatus]|nr:hypothetical protein EV424DRAFT_1536324 [Suillus variegatus]